MKFILVILGIVLSDQSFARSCTSEIAQATEILKNTESAVSLGNASPTSEMAALLKFWDVLTICDQMSLSFFCNSARPMAQRLVRASEDEVKLRIRASKELSGAEAWLHYIEFRCR